MKGIAILESTSLLKTNFRKKKEKKEEKTV